MRYNVFNPTGKVIREHVKGEEIVIQPLSCASVTEKKTKAIMALHPELTLGHTGQYADQDLAVLRTLKKDQLLEVATLLARNVPVNLQDYVPKKDVEEKDSDTDE